METVLNVLKTMEKATAREIAARMEIEPRDALEMLNEQQDTGTVTFRNGYWSLSGVAPAKAVKRETPKPEAPKVSTVKIGEQQLTDAIRENGPLTSEDLAAMFDVTSRKVVATLANATGKGRLIRVKQDGKFRYCLPEQALPETDAAPAPEMQQDATSAIDASTASDTVQETDKNVVVLAESRQDGMTLPTPKEISRVIRKLKSALHQAEQARESIMAVRKHEKTLSRLTRSLRELQS